MENNLPIQGAMPSQGGEQTDPNLDPNAQQVQMDANGMPIDPNAQTQGTPITKEDLQDFYAKLGEEEEIEEGDGQEPNEIKSKYAEYGIEDPNEDNILKRLGELKLQSESSNIKHPILKQINDLVENGADLKEVVRLIGQDYKSMDEEDVLRAKLKRDGLNDEEIESELNDFVEESKFSKKNIIKNAIEQMEQEDNNLLKEYKSPLTQREEMDRTNTEKAIKRIEEITDMAKKNGRIINGYEIPEEVLDNVSNDLKTGKMFLKSDGSLNAEKLFKMAVKERMFDEILKKELGNAETKGKMEIFNQIVNPSTNPKNQIIPRGKEMTAKEIAKLEQVQK